MEKSELILESLRNLAELKGNPYPGRGIIVGLDESGENLVQVYWIMGRSENSRNRVFGHDSGGRVFTEAADPSKVKDPSLIIYNAMREALINRDNDMVYFVSNGSQTDAVAEWCMREFFHETMRRLEYEPDAPNFTPRITAGSYWGIRTGKPCAKISLLRKSFWSDACDRHMFEFNDLGPGFGYCVTTYMGDGSPLPSFRGEPYLLPLAGNAYQVADEYWGALNSENKVSLVVKFIPKKGPSQIVIHNKYLQVG